MPSGICVWNADGTLQFDSSKRLFRLLTAADIGDTSSGSYTVSGVQGTLKVVAIPTEETGTAPVVTVSGNNVSWNYGAGGRQRQNLIMVEY
ncbi:hypothetical protein MNO14_05075 [Luteimonas sp. S4-F44]|uniref:hypothetical protein n=1 Tax=Luteimonas sp. S4-F44 TaxID=2925842 RepID=UPI001F537E00|nr:hypothetical protein [Luteimonas sp. S4-F44]UNK43459.1 hypothetical protein MNO14_05075 [Luteimonas sp. S4-F44]